ncbi:jg9815 [Pararge aegeria aegeria]|uniref:Jg9815 protein n=1 Tax=Pararge aegeria aegeria TaxID=348720 RepID=A0A8S4RLH2_9NEOP|nr:jg9815 [Pararge aegeria aegeria]
MKGFGPLCTILAKGGCADFTRLLCRTLRHAGLLMIFSFTVKLRNREPRRFFPPAALEVWKLGTSVPRTIRAGIPGAASCGLPQGRHGWSAGCRKDRTHQSVPDQRVYQRLRQAKVPRQFTEQCCPPVMEQIPLSIAVQERIEFDGRLAQFAATLLSESKAVGLIPKTGKSPNSQNPHIPLNSITPPTPRSSSASTPLQSALHQPLWLSRAFHALHMPLVLVELLPSRD